MRDLASFPEHWRRAANAVGITLPEHLFESGGKKITHMLVQFNLQEHKDWASTHLLSDFLNVEPVEKRFGLPRGSIQSVLVRYVSLNPEKIRANDFRVRYPDVPYKIAHDFVLLHELGHCLRGSKEGAADRYAFDRLLLPEDPKAKEKRDVWYGRMKDPFEKFMSPPERT